MNKLTKEEIGALARKLQTDVSTERAQKRDSDFKNWQKSKEVKKYEKAFAVYTEAGAVLYGDKASKKFDSYLQTQIFNRLYPIKSYYNGNIADLIILEQMDSSDLADLIKRIKAKLT